MTTWFSSDQHLFHVRAAKFRGFPNVDAMNRTLIDNHNARVKPGDIVYWLGDLSFGSLLQTYPLLQELKGQINLIPGNHDKRLLKDHKKVAHVVVFPKVLAPIVNLKQNMAGPNEPAAYQRFVLCHFPILSWDGAHHGSIHLHGHSHGNLRFPNPSARIMDVGVDPNDLYPVSLDEVMTHMIGADYKSFDHHVEKSDEQPESV